MSRCAKCGAEVTSGLPWCQICSAQQEKPETVHHPAHYGGEHNPYETIKVIEAWKLGFNLGNAVKYISRADHKGASIEDIRKAIWYLQRELKQREGDL